MTIKKCPICNKGNFRLLKRVKGVNIYECLNCQLGITDQSKKISKVRLYTSPEFYNLKEYKKEEEKHTRKFKKIIQLIKKYVRRGRVLDVGGGYGLFARLFSNERGMIIEVIEPNLQSNYLKETRAKIFRTTFQSFLAKNKTKYDLICFNDVLEHVDNPSSILRSSKEILRDYGYISILLPNYKSIMAKGSKNWSWWMVEDHKFHFSAKSLQLILEKSGFTVKYMTTFEDPHDFKLNLNGGRVMKLFIIYPFLFIYRLLKKIFWKFNYGGLLFVIAKK